MSKPLEGYSLIIRVTETNAGNTLISANTYKEGTTDEPYKKAGKFTVNKNSFAKIDDLIMIWEETVGTIILRDYTKGQSFTHSNKIIAKRDWDISHNNIRAVEFVYLGNKKQGKKEEKAMQTIIKNSELMVLIHSSKNDQNHYKILFYINNMPHGVIKFEAAKNKFETVENLLVTWSNIAEKITLRDKTQNSEFTLATEMHKNENWDFNKALTTVQDSQVNPVFTYKGDKVAKAAKKERLIEGYSWPSPSHTKDVNKLLTEDKTTDDCVMPCVVADEIIRKQFEATIEKRIAAGQTDAEKNIKKDMPFKDAYAHAVVGAEMFYVDHRYNTFFFEWPDRSVSVLDEKTGQYFLKNKKELDKFSLPAAVGTRFYPGYRGSHLKKFGSVCNDCTAKNCEKCSYQVHPSGFIGHV